MSNSYRKFFQELTSFESPYEYQELTFEKFLQCKNFIIQAPTGSGKTWAAIVPFVYCWKEWKEKKQKAEEYPRKLIYSLPLRTLANSLYGEVSDKIRQKFPELKIKVTLQTGENSDDPLFEGDIIFTTIDQTLSNSLGIPLSVPKKLANINTGAVLSSYLVFDEFHLLDPKNSLKTTITLLELFGRITPFCLMTATLSEQFLELASKKFNAAIVKIQENDYQNFVFVRNKAEKKIVIINNTITSENILRNHKIKSIAICNTVDRCIELYRDLEGSCKNNNIKLLCIHSRFFQRDRKEKEVKLRKLFKEDSNESVILISTQVIEVGLDISSDTMHVEISPVNSFLQRIGRCARWGGNGTVFVYDTPKQNYLPYDSSLTKTTFIEVSNYHKKQIDFYISQKIIKTVLGEYEIKIFDEINNSEQITWQNIHDSWRTGNQSYVRTLIRDIRSINIVLLPYNIKTNSLYKFDSISMNPFSLKKKISGLLDNYVGEQPNLVMKLNEYESNFIDDSKTDTLEIKTLQRVDIENIYLENIVALNSNEIKYSKDYGLDFVSGENVNSKIEKGKDKFQYQIKMDTYEEHINWMLKVFENMHEVFYPIKKIQDYKYQKFDLIEIIKLIIVMHDYGKLNNLWQQIVCDYQKEKSDKVNEKYLAHTDFNPNSIEDKELLSKIYSKYNVNKKPDHAGIGAFVTKCFLPFVLELEVNNENKSLLKIVTTTILRHHSAFAKTVSPYKISEDAIKFQNEKLLKGIVPQFYIRNTKQFPLDSYGNEDLSSELIQFGDKLEAILYFLFIRVLRLCDQKSFEFNK